jgi:hypothetical protein
LRLGSVLAAQDNDNVGSCPSLGLRINGFLGLYIKMIMAWKHSSGESYLVVGDVMNGGLIFGAFASRNFTLFLGGLLEKGGSGRLTSQREGLTMGIGAFAVAIDSFEALRLAGHRGSLI